VGAVACAPIRWDSAQFQVEANQPSSSRRRDPSFSICLALHGVDLLDKRPQGDGGQCRTPSQHAGRSRGREVRTQGVVAGRDETPLVPQRRRYSIECHMSTRSARSAPQASDFKSTVISQGCASQSWPMEVLEDEGPFHRHGQLGVAHAPSPCLSVTMPCFC
jgi:hypothetical protein